MSSNPHPVERHIAAALSCVSWAALAFAGSVMLGQCRYVEMATYWTLAVLFWWIWSKVVRC